MAVREKTRALEQAMSTLHLAPSGPGKAPEGKGEEGGRGLQEPRCCPEPHQGGLAHGIAVAGAARGSHAGLKNRGKRLLSLSPLCWSRPSSLETPYSEWGPQTSSCSITQKLAGNVESQAPPQALQIRDSERQPTCQHQQRVGFSVSMDISNLFRNSKKCMHLCTRSNICIYVHIYCVYYI